MRPSPTSYFFFLDKWFALPDTTFNWIVKRNLMLDEVGFNKYHIVPKHARELGSNFSYRRIMTDLLHESFFFFVSSSHLQSPYGSHPHIRLTSDFRQSECAGFWSESPWWNVVILLLLSSSNNILLNFTHFFHYVLRNVRSCWYTHQLWKDPGYENLNSVFKLPASLILKIHYCMSTSYYGNDNNNNNCFIKILSPFFTKFLTWYSRVLHIKNHLVRIWYTQIWQHNRSDNRLLF